jgi:lycopene cyclase domain-containing protein
MGHFSHLTMIITAGVCFQTLFWARNAAFLWSRRWVIAQVVGIAELWQLVSEPIGGFWRAWSFNPERVLGVWVLGYIPIEDILGIAVVSSAAASGVLVFGYSPRRGI